MTKLEESCTNAEKTFGSIYCDLKQLLSLITKIIDYYAAKKDPSEPSLLVEKLESNILPLFPTIEEPSEVNVGSLIDLKCGHTQRPSDLETVMFTVHLEAAGFYNNNKTTSPVQSGRNSPGAPARKASDQKKSMTLNGKNPASPNTRNSLLKNKANSAAVVDRQAKTLKNPKLINLKEVDAKMQNSATKLLSDNTCEDTSFNGQC